MKQLWQPNNQLIKHVCTFFEPPFKNQTIWQPDMFQPFEYWTSLVFGWLLYLVI